MKTIVPAAARRRASSPCIVIAWGCVALLATSGRAEFPRPQLNAIQPPGGQRGTAFEVTLVGVDLDDLSGLRFSHPGIVARHVMSSPTDLDPEPRPVPGKMRVEIAADVPTGLYDAVATCRFGVSNPRLFMVGASPEVARAAGIGTPATAADVPADATVSGVATANAADHYAVALAAGQRIRLDVWSRRLDSRMTTVLTVADPGGRIVARARRLHGEDPYLDFVARDTGRHVIRIHDMYMGGGDDMPYRLVVSSGPVVESVFPPVAPAGTTARLTALGRGLPGGSPAGDEGLDQVAIDAVVDPDVGTAGGRFAWRLFAARDIAAELVDVSGGVLDPAVVSPAVLAAADAVTPEQEPNNEPAQQQKIALPAVVAGRFQPRGDRDWLAFDAKAGDEWVFDLYSRRLGLPTDPSLLLQSVTTAADGTIVAKDIAFADDGPAEIQGGILDRPSFDPTITFKAPADGTYRLLVRELAADSRAGSERAWVLEARKPVPGFRLVVPLAQPDRADANKLFRTVPSLQVGGRMAIDVLVVRIDGFAGEVALEPQGLPAGVTAPPTVIPGNANRGVLVLSAADTAQPFNGSFRVLGRGRSGDRDVDDVARVAALVWNVDDANAPQVMRESFDIPLAVTIDAAPLTVGPREQKSWELQPEGKLEVPLDVVRRPGAKGPLSLTAAGLPAELKVTEVKIDEAATEAKVEVAAAAKLPPGTYTVLLKGVVKHAFARNPQAAERARADADRLAALAKERAAKLDAAKQLLAATEAKEGDPQAAEAKAAAAEAVKAAEAAATAAEAERARREEVAKNAATAAAPKDIDVPVILPPITIVVAAPKPAEEPKQ
jgi:hypothetical protein